MKKSSVFGVALTLLLGSLLHFTYQWSGGSPVVALFSAVNESTWEHMKLLMFPYTAVAAGEYFLSGKAAVNFRTAKAAGLLSGLLLIPLIFYTYTAVLGRNYLAIDILTFVVAVVGAYVVSYFVMKRDSYRFDRFAVVVFAMLVAAFFIFTFKTPETRLFLDPVTGTFGL